MFEKLIRNFALQFNESNIIFPVYHAVSDFEIMHIKHLYKHKNIAQFEKELDYFIKHYIPISLEEVLTHIKNKTKPKKPSFHISFDDGFKECYDIILPILNKRNISATFFLITDFIDNKGFHINFKTSILVEKIKNSTKDKASQFDLNNLDDENNIDFIAHQLGVDFDEHLNIHKPFLSSQQIEEIISSNHTIGAHTLNHPYYAKLPFEEQIYQTEKSLDYITSNFNIDYKVFAFPYNDNFVSYRFFEHLQKHSICDLCFGAAGIKNDDVSINIQRLSIELGENFNQFIQKEYIKIPIRTLVGKNTVRHER